MVLTNMHLNCMFIVFFFFWGGGGGGGGLGLMSFIMDLMNASAYSTAVGK